MRRGFSIIELMVVLALLSIGVAIALPNAGSHCHGYGNEARAIRSLKQINAAQAAFRERRLAGGRYGDLRELAEAGLVEAQLGKGVLNGYVFEAGPSPGAPGFLWFATARPVAPRTTGDRYFAVNHAGVIFYTCAAPIAVPRATCVVPRGPLPVGK